MDRYAYAVHTEACTYFLDEHGICRKITAPNRPPSPSALRCLEAHFVACVDPSISGCLTGELTVGTCALFVGVSPDTGRPVLLRTGQISGVYLPANDTARLQAITLDLTDEVELEEDEPVKPVRKRAGSIPGVAGRTARRKAIDDAEAAKALAHPPARQSVVPRPAARPDSTANSLKKRNH